MNIKKGDEVWVRAVVAEDGPDDDGDVRLNAKRSSGLKRVFFAAPSEIRRTPPDYSEFVGKTADQVPDMVAVTFDGLRAFIGGRVYSVDCYTLTPFGAASTISPSEHIITHVIKLLDKPKRKVTQAELDEAFGEPVEFMGEVGDER